MGFFQASSGGSGSVIKTQTATTMTSLSNGFVAFPTDRAPLYATVTISGSGYPCLLMDFNSSSYRVCASGYFNTSTGAFTKFSGNTNYTINYVYLDM